MSGNAIIVIARHDVAPGVNRVRYARFGLLVMTDIQTPAFDSSAVL